MSFIQQFFTSRDNGANAETFVGQEGRLWWNPETNQIYSSDGNTPGGIPLAGGGGGNGTPGGSNSQVQFNQNGAFGGTANLTIDRTTGALTAVSFVGNGASLTSITGANVTGTVANATYAVSAGSSTTATSATTAGTVTTNDQPNITSVGTLTGITSTGNISTTGNVVGNYILGNGSQLTGLSATYGNANVAAYLPTYTGNLAALTGNVTTTANLRGGNLSVVGSINLGGLITATGNITGGNLLTGANVSATSNITGGNLISNGLITAVGNVAANYFVGNGAALIAITGANVTGTVANATYATSAGTATSATTAATVTTNAQPNITSVGTLTTVTVTGNVQGGNLRTEGVVSALGRIISSGEIYSATQLTGGNINGANIVANGSLCATGNVTGNYYIGNGSLLTGITSSYGNANVVANLAALGTNPVSTTGNVTAGYFIGNGSALTSITGANITGTVANATYAISAGTATSATTAATVTTNAQPNITSVGTLTSATVTGNITGGNILTGGLISATGNITGGNLNAVGLSLSGNVVSAINTTANITTTGNTRAGNLIGSNLTATRIPFVGTGGVITDSIVMYTDQPNQLLYVGGGGAYIGGTGGFGTVNATRHEGGTVSVTGNITTGGNLNVAGNIIDTGALSIITGNNGNIALAPNGTGIVTVSGAISAVGNVTGGNILTGGLISATGNITGGNILGGANVNATTHTGSTVSMSGNVTGGNVIATATVYANAVTAFVAGTAAISGVALQMPQEGALRNLNNGLTNMYFDVSTGGSTNGQFQFRSSNAFTNVLTMSPTAFNVNTEAVVTAKTASFGRLAWNSAIDTELTVDNYRFRVSNQGGIFPQIISNTGGTVNSAWTVVAARSGSAIAQGGSTGTLVPNNAWTSLYTFGGMDSAGDTFIATLQDKSAGRIYRVTFMRSDNGATTGYNIIAERLI